MDAPEVAVAAPGRSAPIAAVLALIGLVVVSAGLAVAPRFEGAPDASGGVVLAIFKCALLAFLIRRVGRRDAYAMQWSSMLILLFMAEGVVRAMTDPMPSSALGLAEAVLSVAYFFAVLVWLRPLKQAARALAAKAGP